MVPMISTHGKVVVNFNLPEYMPSAIYSLNNIRMSDDALNESTVYFTDDHVDEDPKTIEVKTKTPDLDPPVLDVNRITIKAEPTIPEAPNGETIVDISFRIKDNISGYEISSMNLRDPQGVMHHFYHYPDGYGGLYFTGNPALFKEYHKRIVLPVGSIPGTWGLAEITVYDKAGNILREDFTEIVRFEVEEGAAASPMTASFPDNTQLLPNYPNPFNPETWIPYQLASSSDVQITIYNMKGSVIRTLALGHQSAGYYTGRSRAAYWDGRNTLGERVASGVYVYQLQADETSFMRKMVIMK